MDAGKNWPPKYIAIIQQKTFRFVPDFTHTNSDTDQAMVIILENTAGHQSC